MTLVDDERHDVLLARDGARALGLCKDERPELIFLGAQMLKMDGITVCQEIRKTSTADTNVIMLTALAQEVEIARALITEAGDYTTKPFSPTEWQQNSLNPLASKKPPPRSMDQPAPLLWYSPSPYKSLGYPIPSCYTFSDVYQAARTVEPGGNLLDQQKGRCHGSAD